VDENEVKFKQKKMCRIFYFTFELINKSNQIICDVKRMKFGRILAWVSRIGFSPVKNDFSPLDAFKKQPAVWMEYRLIVATVK
jgi:hypothetical protein